MLPRSSRNIKLNTITSHKICIRHRHQQNSPLRSSDTDPSASATNRTHPENIFKQYV